MNLRENGCEIATKIEHLVLLIPGASKLVWSSNRLGSVVAAGSASRRLAAFGS